MAETETATTSEIKREQSEEATSSDALVIDEDDSNLLDSKGKLKQTPEDKRKRNYIAVRKHRQQLKNTLEQCPIELVELKKELDELKVEEAEKIDEKDNLLEFYKQCKLRMKDTRSEPSASHPYDRSLNVSPEEDEARRKNNFKRPRRVFGDNQQDFVSQSPVTISPVWNFQSPLFPQGLVTPGLTPGFINNFVAPPFFTGPFLNQFLMPSTPATPMQSPVTLQPTMMTVTPDQFQGMMVPDTLHATVRTAPINFTQDTIESLWKLHNEQWK